MTSVWMFNAKRSTLSTSHYHSVPREAQSEMVEFPDRRAAVDL
jgi:hypothetical protein